MNRFAAFLMLGVLAGCAAPAMRPLPDKHPANSDALVAEFSRPNALQSEAPSEGAAHDDAVHSQASGRNRAHGEHEPDAAAPASQTLFRCPMHPEVTSSDPEARCPQCGMKLERVDEGGRP